MTNENDILEQLRKKIKFKKIDVSNKPIIIDFIKSLRFFFFKLKKKNAICFYGTEFLEHNNDI